MQNDMLLARPYARAWFLCGQEAQLLDEYASCLEVLADCVLTPKVQHLISNPTVMLQDLVKLFETVLAQQIDRMSIPSDAVQGCTINAVIGTEQTPGSVASHAVRIFAAGSKA